MQRRRAMPVGGVALRFFGARAVRISPALPVTEAHLDDDAISAYASHRMVESERSLAEEHLSSCDLCLALACAAARDHESEAPGPRRIGRYEVKELLGEGAMGS